MPLRYTWRMPKRTARADKPNDLFANVPIEKAGRYAVIGADRTKKAISFGRGTGSVYPWQNTTTGKTYWVVRWQEGGKRKARYFEQTPEGHRLAEAFARDRKATKVVDLGGEQPVAEFLTSWLKSVKDGVRPQTFIFYERCVRLASEFLPADVTVRGLRTEHVQQMIDA